MSFWDKKTEVKDNSFWTPKTELNIPNIKTSVGGASTQAIPGKSTKNFNPILPVVSWLTEKGPLKGPTERLAAVRESFLSKSLTPLKENIKKQSEELSLKGKTTEQISEIAMSHVLGFLGGTGDISRKLAQNAARDFASQQVKKYATYAGEKSVAKVMPRLTQKLPVTDNYVSKLSLLAKSSPDAKVILDDLVVHYPKNAQEEVAKGMVENLVARRLTPEIKTNIVSIIDDYTKGAKNLTLQEDAAKIAEHLDLPMPKTYGKLVNSLRNVLEKSEEYVVKDSSLINEARKYNTAEEFIKAQGNPILHGTNKNFKEFDITKRGMNEKDIPSRESFFFTDSLETAKSYGKNLQERYGKFKKPLTIDADGKMYGDMREELRGVVLKAKKEGNDVVIIKNLSDRKDWGNYEPATHYAVIDTNSLLTKSQLTDIWNKAKKSEQYVVKDSSLINEARKYNTAEEFVKAQETRSPNYAKGGGSGHTAPLRDEDNAPLYSLDKIYPKNIYSQDAHRLYSSGYKIADKKAFEIVNKVKNNPDADVIIYRAVPKGKGITGFNKGDWVTLTKEYAQQHGESNLNGNFDILSKKVKADEIFTDANSIQEFGYDPRSLSRPQLTDIWNRAKKYWNSMPNKQGGFARMPFTNRPSDIDKFIAEGKVRVVSRNRKDVYQIKKGGEWVDTQSEASAISQLTRPKVSKAVELPEAVQNEKIKLEVRKEALANSPFANKDNRLLVDREGRIRELGDTTGKLSNKIEDMMREAGVEDPREYASGVEKYLEEKANIKLQEEFVRKMEKVAREKIAMEKGKTISQKPQPKPSIIDTTEGEGRSIEIQAQQALEVLKGDNVPMDVSFPSIIEKTVTKVNEKVHTIDTFLRTPKYVMEKIGFGKESQELRNAMDSYWKELPKNINKITEWSKRASKGSNIDIFKYLDGEPITLLPQDKQIALEIKDWLQEWAKRLKLPQDKKVSHYITHIFDQELIAKEFDEDLAKIIADKIPGQVYDPFLEKRLGAKGYKQDTWAALDAYVKRGTRKAWMDPVLEKIKERTGSSLDMSNIEKSQFEYIQKYINNINLRPSGTEEGVDNFIKSIIGYKFGQRPTTAILRLFRQATFRGMLGLNPSSALRNLSQGANTFAVLGTKNTALGYLNLFKKGAGAELEREGVLNAGFVQDRALSAGKKVIENFDKTLFYLFQTAEKINRGAAYFGAKSEALAKGMTEEKAIEYAKEIVRKTQFSFDVVDTPVGMSSDIMKTLLQFQTFTTKQIEFLGGMARKAVAGDEKAKNFIGLLRYAFAGLLFVYTIGKAFGMEPKELIPWYRFQAPASLKAPIEVTKAVLDVPDKFGNKRTIGEKAKDIAESVVGLIPAGSQMKKTYQGVKSINEGGSYDASGRLQFEQTPGWGAKIQAILFGKYAQQNAKQYFDRVEINAKEKAKVQPIYDEVQKLISEGNDQEAQSVVDELSDDDYSIYKKIKASEKAKKTLEGKKKMMPIYNDVQKMGKEEAQAKIDSMTDEEYEYYKAIKKDKENIKKASNGEKPKFDPNETQSDNTIIDTIVAYSKAIGTDPITAFKRIFSGERIRYVANDAIVVERLPMSESQAIKNELGGNNPTMKLDHTIPLQLGGTNDRENLRLVPTDEWATYTPVENAIGEALRFKKISKDEAQKLIKDFKNGKITSEDVYNKLK